MSIKDDTSHLEDLRTDKTWFQSFTGRKVWPLDLHSDEVDIRDIAHALSNECRFAGHCKAFYSVAQHSVLVAHYLPERLKKHGLLHDASEAYLKDMPRPIKHHPGMAFYRQAEARAMEAIWAAFSLPILTHHEAMLLKQADDQALATERRDLKEVPPDLWADLDKRETRVQPWPEEICPWEPWQAEVAFFQMAVNHGLTDDTNWLYRLAKDMPR